MRGVLKRYNSKYIYALDAGHGINTQGKRSPVWADGTQLFEWEYNRQIREEIVALLDIEKISYYIVNPEKFDVSLSERALRINRELAGYKKIAISIHGNAAGAKEAQGFEVFTTRGTTMSDKLAEIMYNKVEKSKLFNMRKDTTDGDSDKEENFTILVQANCPIFLTESGFYTNEVECKKMMTTKFVKAVAKLHVDAIKEFENVAI